MTARRSALAVVLLLALLAASGCGRGGHATATTPGARPPIGAKSEPVPADGGAGDLGFPAVATKNTIRVAGRDPVDIAAAAGRAVYPGTAAGTRPDAVTLVDAKAWQTAVAAAALDAPPLRAPLLFTRGATVPPVTATALAAMAPQGSKAAAGAQVIRVGTTAGVGKLKSTDVKAGDPFAAARALDAFITAARGSAGTRVLLASADDPSFAAPAAAYAAKSGYPVLFTHKASVPADTIAALKTHGKPRIYVLGPSTVITPAVTKQLKGIGRVVRVGGADPGSNSINFARLSDEGFGWGIVDPGHGMVFLPEGGDPALPAAAASLSASGAYGPALVLSSPAVLDAPMRAFLLDIQPGYTKDPVRGVYNRAWLIGDTTAITPALQAQIDGNLEITAVADKGTK